MEFKRHDRPHIDPATRPVAEPDIILAACPGCAAQYVANPALLQVDALDINLLRAQRPDEWKRTVAQIQEAARLTLGAACPAHPDVVTV
jgi:hypothetical protein